PRGTSVAALEIEAVSALAGVEGQLVLVQHLAGPADPFQRLRCLVFGQGLLEGRPRTLPVPARESRPSRFEGRVPDQSLRTHRHTLEEPCRSHPFPALTVSRQPPSCAWE